MQSEAAQKHGVFDKQEAKQDNVYGIQKSEIRNNYSDERLDAFHENLKMNVSYDRKPDWTLSKKADEHDRKAYQAYIQMMSSISHYADRSKDPLFAHEPSLNDVKQGCLGDCYMLAGVSTLIKEQPEKIKECRR